MLHWKLTWISSSIKNFNKKYYIINTKIIALKQKINSQVFIELIDVNFHIQFSLNLNMICPVTDRLSLKSILKQTHSTVVQMFRIE